MIYNGLLKFDWPNTRLPSVLGRIGLAYLFAGLIVLNTGVRGRIAWIVGLLVGYWAALKFIPVPGFGAGDLSPGHTLTDYIDRLLIPGQLYRVTAIRRDCWPRCRRSAPRWPAPSPASF